jgi:hypothetical protein
MNEQGKATQGALKALKMSKEKEHQEQAWKKNTKNEHEK